MAEGEGECAFGNGEGEVRGIGWRTEWISRVNGQVEVEQGRLIWKLLACPSLEHAAEDGRESGEAEVRGDSGYTPSNKENSPRNVMK